MRTLWSGSSKLQCILFAKLIVKHLLKQRGVDRRIENGSNLGVVHDAQIRTDDIKSAKIDFTRLNSYAKFKKARHWFVYLRYLLFAAERHKISVAVENDFAMHFPSRRSVE